ncbi:ribose 5-phosphate isomerase B [Actinotalea fermentans]|uniref:Ribose 5-phosphate isomerase B n=1 Tax=Actinotalea fermentans TaxID=43671 RepID=A0A511YZN2_9CELL|nr:ribose 5-phosphate isomerase B [Actinotalea fermentans]KGM17074.1 ribose 5-phosphate isomerase [Actinotalea fermentans ATCC 43279 = JCM 9966 = DSM 3133]GEN80633.1 ribose 5-phosphate isomerase B [Actinotalea fermentans]
MRVALASDHVGIELKGAIAELLDELSIEHSDLGPYDPARTDYPLHGSRAARAVAEGRFDRAILVCGTGIGISIAANKIPGIRCVACSEPYSAVLSRHHNDTNALALGARVVGVDLAKMIVREWIAAPYEGGRHAVRVAQLAALEHGICL